MGAVSPPGPAVWGGLSLGGHLRPDSRGAGSGLLGCGSSGGRGAAVASCCGPSGRCVRRFGACGPSRAHWGLAPPSEVQPQPRGSQGTSLSLTGALLSVPGSGAPLLGAGPARPGLSPRRSRPRPPRRARGLSPVRSLGLAPHSWGLEPHSRASSPRGLGLSKAQSLATSLGSWESSGPHSLTPPRSLGVSVLHSGTRSSSLWGPWAPFYQHCLLSLEVAAPHSPALALLSLGTRGPILSPSRRRPGLSVPFSALSPVYRRLRPSFRLGACFPLPGLGVSARAQALSSIPGASPRLPGAPSPRSSLSRPPSGTSAASSGCLP